MTTLNLAIISGSAWTCGRVTRTSAGSRYAFELVRRPERTSGFRTKRQCSAPLLHPPLARSCSVCAAQTAELTAPRCASRV